MTTARRIDDRAPAPAARVRGRRSGRRALPRPRRGALPAGRRDRPADRHVARAPRPRRPARATRAATRSSSRSTTSGRTSARSRRSTRPSCPPSARFERDLELHNVRRELFDLEELRLWERRSFGLDAIGDSLFLLFARDYAPLAERLDAISGRLEGVAAFLEASKTRATVPQVRRWQELEIEEAHGLPGLFDEFVAAGTGVLAAPEATRLERAVASAGAAVEAYAAWLRGTLADGTDDWPIGRERHDALVAHRAFDGLDADEILELGWQKLAEEQAARVAAAREIDPDADEADGPGPHQGRRSGRLRRRRSSAYRTAMLRARAAPDRPRPRHGPRRRAHRRHRDARVPAQRHPVRGVLLAGRRSTPDPKGIYVVTPSVGDDPDAMLEHNLASISNTSIHEAYPGHHLQLDVARRHPSLTRLLTDAPEFVEGWGMYSELLMREHGFDDDARFRVILHTDAIWRACRMILDVRMHRGELTAEEATDFLVEQTGFQRSNAAAEVGWYTYRPTYPLSYLLGRTLLLGLRADEQRRLGDAFSLKGFHDTLLRNGSLPISFHRRALAGEGAVGR